MGWFKFRKFVKSINYAYTGIVYAIKNQSNFAHQLLFFIALGIVNIIIDFSISQWLYYIAIHGLIVAMEVANTAIEQLCDLYSLEANNKIKIIKDCAAGAVLMTIMAVVAFYLALAYPNIIVFIHSHTPSY